MPHPTLCHDARQNSASPSPLSVTAGFASARSATRRAASVAIASATLRPWRILKGQALPSAVLPTSLPDAGALDTLKFVREGRNVCVLRTCSKIHGLAALRVGYGLASKGVAALLQKARQPFNVNAIGQAGALAALADTEHIERTRAVNREGLAFYQTALQARGIHFVPSVANFLLIEVGDGDRVFADMLKQGVIVRAMRSYKLPGWVRISMGTPAQNARCLAVLDAVLAGASV